MDAEYVLFEDRRESEGVVNDAREFLAGAQDLSGHSVLVRLRALDWNYPAFLVHRSDGENRWSQVMLGLSSPETGD